MGSVPRFLARNILIHKQVCSVVSEFNRNGIDCLLLKGAGLIETFPEYAFSRDMEDIDILVKRGSLKRAKDVLISIGYSSVRQDPFAFFKHNVPARVDLCDGLWYLDSAENLQVFTVARKFLNADGVVMKTLPPEEFYLHIFAHARLHHVREEKTWTDDLALLSNRWAGLIDRHKMSAKMKRYGFDKISGNPVYRWFVERDVPLKGHIFRFFFLPTRKKFLYINNILFPPVDFIRGRYSLGSDWQAVCFGIVRPVLLLFQFLRFVAALAVASAKN